jgi:hypothetical protein
MNATVIPAQVAATGGRELASTAAERERVFKKLLSLAPTWDTSRIVSISNVSFYSSLSEAEIIGAIGAGRSAQIGEWDVFIARGAGCLSFSHRNIVPSVSVPTVIPTPTREQQPVLVAQQKMQMQFPVVVARPAQPGTQPPQVDPQQLASEARRFGIRHGGGRHRQRASRHRNA